MRVGLVYTSTTPELIEMVEAEVKKQLGEEVTCLTYTAPEILAQTREAGYVTAKAAGRLMGLYSEAVMDGADAILNICSSVGEVADAAQDMGRYMGVPIVRIDEEMCRDAVRMASSRNGRVGVLATLPTTLEPTKNTLGRVARELGKRVQLVDGLIDAFGADQEGFKRLMTEKALAIKEDVDVILLCQGSMAYVEALLEETCGIPVVSSPRYGAEALKEALKAKGLL